MEHFEAVRKHLRAIFDALESYPKQKSDRDLEEDVEALGFSFWDPKLQPNSTTICVACVQKIQNHGGRFSATDTDSSAV